MDKLREILVYRFWGLLAIALIVPIVGWWIGSGDAASAIAARKDEIKSAFSAVPTSNFINEKWIAGVKAVNDEQQKLIDSAWQKMAEGQINLKTWPPEIADEIAKLGPTEEVPVDYRNIYYPKGYQREWAEVWLIVDPVRDGKYDEEKMETPTTGIVEFEVKDLPIQSWGDGVPTTQEMRDAQEDIWLYRSLLEAIADVNNGVEHRADAVITRIENVELLTEFLPKESLATFGAPENVEPPPPGAPKPKKDKGKKHGKEVSQEEIDSAGIEDFIDDSSAPLEQFFEKQVQNTGFAAEGDWGGFDEPADAGPYVPRRYVEDLPQYKTRGFNMVVEMDHLRLPDLLASLSNSPWPIKILRVEQTIGTSHRGHSKKDKRDKFDEQSQYNSASNILTGVNGRPHLVQVEITGTMRVYKSKDETEGATTSPGGFGQQPAVATVPADGTPADGSAPNKPHAVARPSFRSAELDDSELLKNVLDQMKGNDLLRPGGGGGLNLFNGVKPGLRGRTR